MKNAAAATTTISTPETTTPPSPRFRTDGTPANAGAEPDLHDRPSSSKARSRADW